VLKPSKVTSGPHPVACDYHHRTPPRPVDADGRHAARTGRPKGAGFRRRYVRWSRARGDGGENARKPADLWAFSLSNSDMPPSLPPSPPAPEGGQCGVRGGFDALRAPGTY
jgi:hypothetical protein